MPFDRAQESPGFDPPDAAGTGVLANFSRSFVYSAAQEPLRGVAQIVDKAAGTHYQDDVSIVERPDPAEFNTLDYWVQQTGAALGAIVPIGLTAVALRSGFNLKPLSYAALTGFVSQSLFRESDGEDWLKGRFLNGSVGAIAFSTMAGTRLGLSQVCRTLEAPLLSATLGNKYVAGTIAGAVAGVAGGQTQSLMSSGRLMSDKDTIEQAFTMGIIGGGLASFEPVTVKQQTASHPAEVTQRRPLESSQLRTLEPYSKTFKVLTQEELMHAPMSELQNTFAGNQKVLLDLLQAQNGKLPLLGFHGTTSERALAILSSRQSEGAMCFSSYDQPPTNSGKVMSNIAAAVFKADSYSHAREGQGRGPILVFDLTELSQTLPSGQQQLWSSLYKHKNFTNPYLEPTTYGENTLQLNPQNFGRRVLGVIENQPFEKYRGELWPKDLPVSMERGQLLEALKAQEFVSAVLKLAAK